MEVEVTEQSPLLTSAINSQKSSQTGSTTSTAASSYELDDDEENYGPSFTENLWTFSQGLGKNYLGMLCLSGSMVLILIVILQFPPGGSVNSIPVLETKTAKAPEKIPESPNVSGPLTLSAATSGKNATSSVRNHENDNRPLNAKAHPRIYSFEEESEK